MRLGKFLPSALGLLLAVIFTDARAKLNDQAYRAIIASNPTVGDLVFTRIGGPVFTRVAATTESWTSHVGIIVDYRHGDWMVAESGVPVVRETPLREFIGHSVNQEFSIQRLRREPTGEEKALMLKFADAQMGRVYSLGFDLQSKKTFCSKFVHDVVYASTRQSIGEVETFDHLLHRNPAAPLAFWRVWFLGSIPWQRMTITPASELNSPLLKLVVKNNV